MTMPTNLRRNASAIALGLALTAWLPAAAMAQDADTAPVDAAPAEGEIIVTGIRVLRHRGGGQQSGQGEAKRDGAGTPAKIGAKIGRHGHLWLPWHGRAVLPAHRTGDAKRPSGSSPMRGLSHLEPRN